MIYPDGQSISASLRIKPFAVLFWALGIVLAHILHSATGDPQTVVLSRQWKVRFNWTEDASAPSLFPGVILIQYVFVPVVACTCMQGWASVLFKKTQRSCVLFHSLLKNGTIFAFFSVLYKRMERSLRFFRFL